jgi:predicted phage terminase large subunit-like protein
MNKAKIQAIGKMSRKKFLERLKGLESDAAKDLFIYYRCATDLALFARYFFPHYCEKPFNLFHKDTFKDYEFEERGVRRVSSAPRGYAKSTIKALIKPIHDLCYKLERFVVVVSNTEAQAVSKLKDIQAELLENDRLVRVYGNLLPSRKAGATDFIASNGDWKIRFLALGSKTEARGIRFGHSRPSKIICDDIEHSTEVENEVVRDKYESLFKDVISKVGNKQTNIEFVGTVLHRKALLVSLLNNPVYESREYKAILSWSQRKDLWEKWKEIYCNLDSEDRKKEAIAFYKANEEEMLKGVQVLWPEHESYYDLQVEIIETGYRSFMKEKQNSPMSSEEKIFDPDQFRYFKEVDEGLYIESTGKIIPWAELRVFGVMDPSTGQTKARPGKKGDFTCILTGYQDKRGRVFVFHDFTKRLAPTQYIKTVFDQFEQFNYEKFGVETNLYRNLLLPNLIDERKRREKEKKKILKIPFYDIEQVENKQKRIYTMEPKVAHGWLMFNRALSQEFFDQMWEFPKGDHDDAPDALEMLWSLIHNRYKPSSLSLGVMDK